MNRTHRRTPRGLAARLAWPLVAALALILVGASQPQDEAKGPAAYKPMTGMPHSLPAETDCQRCHSAEGFKVIVADKVHQDGRFPLEGEHGRLPCASCHDVAAGFMGLSGECTTCHAVRDAHLRLVGDDCAACHTPRGWLPNRFRHISTGFPLTGAHRAANCDQCHAIGFPLVPTDCVYCHEADFRRASGEHQAEDLMSCDLCHDSHGWEHVRFPH